MKSENRGLLLILSLLSILVSCETKTKLLDRCGDGVVDPGEDCDRTDLGGHDCLSLGYYHEGRLVCTSQCRFDTSDCGGRCGDGVLEKDRGEECDQFDLDGQDCESMGFSGGELSCKEDCSFSYEGCFSVCGNGIVEPDEECDDGNRVDGDGCDSWCHVETGFACEGQPSECDILCGDGILSGDEVCDGNTLGGLSCAVLGYYGGILLCQPDCMSVDESDCSRYGRCGDGVHQGPHGEECDGADLGELTCEDLGYSHGSGALSCTEHCRFDKALCVPRSSDADLSDMVVGGSALVPVFSSEKTVYETTVPLSATTLSVTAVTSDPWATVAFSPAQPMVLVEGGNPVTVMVTAEDGSQKQYSLLVHRTNDYLSPYIGLMKYVPDGSFLRDSNFGNRSRVAAFRMGTHEITRAQWTAVTGWTDPSNTLYTTVPEDPVQRASWYYAIAFCNKLSLLENLTPVYAVSGVDFSTLEFSQIPINEDAEWNAATADWNANGYRLPTEMEWMWAAMGADAQNPGVLNQTGYSKPFAGSNGTNLLGDYVWYNINSGGITHPVGLKLPNELGLYDMSGNVFELLWDWYESPLPSGFLEDYRGPVSGEQRMVKGGSFSYTQSSCAINFRPCRYPSRRFHDIGFRVVRP